MGKKSRRKLGARPYADYSQETLKLAVDLVKTKSLSSYEAEKQFGIPRRTILNHCRNENVNAIGRPNELSVEDERHIADVVEIAGKYGCPLTLLDLRLVVNNYLQKTGKTHLFNGKIPGDRWARSFLERYNFAMRDSQNIKRTRASKTNDEMSTYFENLKISIDGIPSKNILNFDETNLTDDPGSSKTAFKRGTKHPERVLNSSKTSISIMFSVTADGECLPPYVVYKAEHLWSQWCQNGPPNARYNRTKSGWFDMACFDDWFKTIVLPWANSLEGSKVIIGDNLSSHLSVEVIQLCRENNIKMVFLPTNSTHLTQPLDVSFFGPMKKTWRKILLDYKIANVNATTLNKTHFPKLLQDLMTNINMTSTKIICSGFSACGIFPFDPSRVLRKIPVASEEETKQFDASLLEYLVKNRNAQTMTKNKSNRKLTVVPGKSVSTEEAIKFIKGKKKSTEKRKINTDVIEENTQTFNGPHSLKSICTNFVNKLMSIKPDNLSIQPIKKTVKKKAPKKNVLLLKNVSQNNKENMPFTAANDRELPICLQSMDIINSDNREVLTLKSIPKPKITIESDIYITAEPGTSGIAGLKYSKYKKQNARLKNIKPVISVGLAALETKIETKKKGKKVQSVKSVKGDRKGIKKDKKNATKRKRRLLQYSSSSTSNSDEISVHSDSSIMDISDENFEPILSETPMIPQRYEVNTEDQCDSSIPGEANAEISQCDSPISKSPEQDDELCPKDLNNLESVFNTNETVLVRYYIRSSWKYFIGVITAYNDDDETFNISFYATMRNKGELKFKKPRRLDRDTVPRDSIIKVIKVSKISDKPEVFILDNSDDTIYF